MCNDTSQPSVFSCSGVKATDRSLGCRSLRANVHTPAERWHNLSARALVLSGGAWRPWYKPGQRWELCGSKCMLDKYKITL